MIDQKVTGDAREPGVERALDAAKRFDGAEDAEENILGEILGFLAAVGEAVADSVNLAGVQANELFPGGLVAAEAAGNQAVLDTMFVQSSSFYII
jgi:hypothetical protein